MFCGQCGKKNENGSLSQIRIILVCYFLVVIGIAITVSILGMKKIYVSNTDPPSTTRSVF